MKGLATALLQLVLSKKILLLVLKLYAKQTDNKLDDSGVKIIEGLLDGNLVQVEEGVVDLIEEVVPEVVTHFENKKKIEEEKE